MNKFVLFAFLMFTVPSVHAQVVTREVNASVHDAYIPESAKSNGDYYVVVSGLFPNGCYSWNRGEVKHNSRFQHDVRVIATVTQTMCIMALVPFNREVVLGPLDTGLHTVRFVNGDGTFFERRLEAK